MVDSNEILMQYTANYVYKVLFQWGFLSVEWLHLKRCNFHRALQFVLRGSQKLLRKSSSFLWDLNREKAAHKNDKIKKKLL